MILRNGILSTVRARTRTILFTALLLLMCLSFTLGLGMWAYCGNQLASLDENYVSIALVEYMGADYPDENAADVYARAAAAALDNAALAAIPGVKLWERQDSTLAHVEGFERMGNAAYPDYAVIEFIQFTEFKQNDNQGYAAVTNDILYARELEGTTAMIVETNGFDFVPEKGRRYTLHGRFTVTNSTNRCFAITEFYEGCETLPWQDTKESAPAPIFYEYAEYYARANNFVTLCASADIAALEVFQQDIFRLDTGRFPQKGESGVCVVSSDMALQMKLSPGDYIDVKDFDSDSDDRMKVRENGLQRRLEVVGIATGPQDTYGYVWLSDAEGGFAADLYGYTLGRAVLDNRTARQAAEAIEALCPDGVRVTLFDQGYSGAAQPLEAMRSTATAVTLASALGALVVLILFAYLFVGRQQENVNILVSLGTPKGKIALWLLSGAVLISAAASAAGAWLGNTMLGKLLEMALAAASSLYAVDSRYSESTVGVVRQAPEMGAVPRWPAVVAFCLVFFASLMFCVVFLRLARRRSAPKKGKLSVRVPKGGTSLLGRGPLRFALLSTRRGGWRSGLVPAAALVLSLLLGILASASADWEGQMDILYRDSHIRGRAVSLDGRRSTDLVIPTEHARTLWKSGLLKDIHVSMGFHYWFPEDIPAFGSGGFAQESRDAWIDNQPQIFALSDMDAAPEFLYSGAPEIDWLEGWDEDFLADPEACVSLPEATTFYHWQIVLLAAEREATAVPCLMPDTVMERFGLELGDSIPIAIRYWVNNEAHEVLWEFIPVGRFTQAGADLNIYAPLTLWCDQDWITGQEEILPAGQRVTMQVHTPQERDQLFYFNSRFSTCVFTLTDPSQLDELRDYLQENNYTRVDGRRSNRTALLLYDRAFVETAGGLGRYIRFSQLLFPVLFVLVAVLGFIISWLVMNTRRMEFAILRGLGTSRSRVFLSFFLEQAMLCLLGCVGAAVILSLATGFVGWLTSVGIFAACYLFGTALSVLVIGRTNLMLLLGERE
ncbi:MAG: hypothetical protein IKU58_00525 [Clostridia bacterium]|nr:hypothetical protein [Clostridia bacterium]